MTHSRLTVLVAVCTIVVTTGCNRRIPPVAQATPPPPVVAEAPPAPPPARDPEPPPAPAATALSEEELFARKTLAELNAERPLGDALFDFDRSVLRDDARAILQTNAEWLRRWTSTRITIEGYCDARGTSEYDLALGERRANAVKDYLVSLDAPDRLLVVARARNRLSASKNRRAAGSRTGVPIPSSRRNSGNRDVTSNAA